jgi:NitT/TauT family transport system ATP-binding protein
MTAAVRPSERTKSDNFLSIANVSKSYAGHDKPTVALDLVDLTIRRGEFLAIVGPSGCGKSTLLQIAAGLVGATTGSIRLNGRDVTAPPPEIVYLFQQYTKSLFPWRKVHDNVAFPLERQSLTRAERHERAMANLELVGLAEFANHYPWQLSGGMQQRVAIARALAAEPSVLLMDEPFSAVDALTRLDLQSLILDIWQNHGELTAVLVTHDVDEAVYLADRVAVMTRLPPRISEVVDIDLPRPRDPIATREDPVFVQHRHALLKQLLARE